MRAIIAEFKNLLKARENAIESELSSVAVTDGNSTWNGWMFNKGKYIACLGAPPTKAFTWGGFSWTVFKSQKRINASTVSCPSITYHPGLPLEMKMPWFVLHRTGVSLLKSPLSIFRRAETDNH